MGLSLGLIGAGGSILTVPILVYLFAIPASRATGWSLLVVGAVSLAGAGMSFRKGEFDARASFQFGIPSVIAAFTLRRFLIPLLPTHFGSVAKDTALLILFAITMLLAAVAMIRSKEAPVPVRSSPLRWIATGLIVGTMTALLGAGGGFLIVPALTMTMGLPMRTAVGSSLAVIALNSSVAWLADLEANGPPDWTIVGPILAVSLFGLFVGVRLRSRVSPQLLRPVFGWFVVAVGCFVILKESVWR